MRTAHSGAAGRRDDGGGAGDAGDFGGTSPKPMFEYFARTDFPWDRVHLFWVDDRCVPPDHEQSNFRMAYDTWLGPARFPGRIFIGSPPSWLPRKPRGATPRTLAGSSSWRGELPRFEVIHLGMGPDAHTASLFPGEPKIDDLTSIAAAVWSEPAKQWRVTLLPGVLDAARHTAMLVAGADKIPALDAVMHARTIRRSIRRRWLRANRAGPCGSWIRPRLEGRCEKD